LLDCLSDLTAPATQELTQSSIQAISFNSQLSTFSSIQYMRLKNKRIHPDNGFFVGEYTFSPTFSLSKQNNNNRQYQQ
jgi:hypothetical protein